MSGGKRGITIGSDYADELYGDSQANTLIGGKGDDQVDASSLIAK